MGRTQDARTQQPPPAPPPQAWWQPALELGDRLKQQLAAAGRELHARQMQLAKNVEHARFPALTPPQSPPPPLPPPQPAAPPPAAAAQRLKQRGKRVATASVTAGSTALSVSGASSGGGATAATAASAEAAASRRAELGRSTWTLLHMLAAQLPDRPSKQQQKDVRGLVDVLTRIYPCGECARHFAQHVK